jgi:hypothetical protein
MENHFHIVWKIERSSKFDYASFKTEQEAKQAAIWLCKPGEEWEVKEFPGDCSFECTVWETANKSTYRPNPKRPVMGKARELIWPNVSSIFSSGSSSPSTSLRHCRARNLKSPDS